MWQLAEKLPKIQTLPAKSHQYFASADRPLRSLSHDSHVPFMSHCQAITRKAIKDPSDLSVLSFIQVFLPHFGGQTNTL